MDPEIYYNPEAMIFDTSPGASQISISPAIEIPAKPVPNPIPVPETSNINKNYHRCIAHVYQEHNYIEGERHTFVFHLALQLRWSGIAEATTLLLLLKDYNYEEKEVRDCVKSAYSYNWTDGPINAQSKASTTNKKKSHNPATSAFKVRKPKGSKDKPTGDGKTPTSDPPNEPPKEEKKESKKQYELEKVEVLLDYWFDFHYNMVTGTVYWRKKGSKKGFKRLEDRDENTMFCMLHHHNQFIPINTLHILITSLYSRDFDPFVEYFKKLRAWDGVTDYIGQLIATVHTTDDDYWAFCFRKWLVAYVASLVEDAIINHTVIVFVGDQGVGKTSWMKTLVPKSLSKYLGTAALQADSKDTAIMLSECALIILDEMESLNRKDLASFKELITRPEIRIRRPYGRNSENLPRRASFIASVNNQQVLTDTTGSRRYLCSNVISIDYQHDIDIDLVLAQGYALYMSGFCYWFNQDDIKVLTIHNEDFTSMSIEEELILTWLRPVTREEWDSRKMYVNGRNIKLMSSTQIGVFLTEKAKFQLTDNTVIKIGKIMKKHGFKRIRKGNSYAYMIRILDGTVVEQSSQTIDDQYEQKTKLESNDQIINYEDTTSGSNVDGELPF